VRVLHPLCLLSVLLAPCRQLVVVGDSPAASMEPFLRRGLSRKAQDDDEPAVAGLGGGTAVPTDGTAIELKPYVPMGPMTSPAAASDSIYGFLWDHDELVGRVAQSWGKGLGGTHGCMLLAPPVPSAPG
jgi:hypothetical protein